MNVIKPADRSFTSRATAAWKRIRCSLKNGRAQPLRFRLFSAAIWTAIGIALRFVLQPFVGERLSYDFPVLFILIVAWSTGAGPAVFALIASFGAELVLFPSTGSSNRDAGVIWEMIHFLVPAMVGIILIESLHRARERLVMESTALGKEVQLRRKSECELDAARQELRDYATQLEKQVSIRTSELQQSVEFQKNFCYAIAHDLKAPVRAMLGFTQVFTEKRANGLTSKDWDLLDRVRQAGLRMDQLVDALLELGQVASVSLRFREVNLDRAAEAALAQTGPALVRAGASIYVEAPLGKAWSDEEMLNRLLRELIENAIRFAQPNVPLRIRVRTKKTDDGVTLCVCDNGVGIAKAYHEKIFGCFQTLCRQEPEHPGAGLAIVAEAAARLHARIKLESDTGEGSCFQITLPLAPPNDLPESGLGSPSSFTSGRASGAVVRPAGEHAHWFKHA